MSPTLEIGDRILCNKLKKTNFSVQDVILFWKPPTTANTHKENTFVMAKRISKIENEGYFVEGDNKLNSRDSHNFGIIHDSLIIGRAAFIVWSDWDNTKKPNERTFVWNRFLKPIE